MILDKTEKKRLFGNFVSLFTLQGLNYILPLLTLPYLVKTLGVEKFGLLSFATAVVSYFAVLTDYGFNFTATREISQNKENSQKLDEVFSSIILIKIFLSFLSLVILLVMINTINKFKVDAIVYLLTFVNVFGQALFPIWFFQGIEQMKYITYVNIISKVFFTISIFLIVKQSSDFYLVPLLVGLGSLIATVISLFIVFNKFKINFELPKLNVIKKYFKGGTNLFLTTGFTTILTSSGTVLLSFFTNNIVVGYYSALEKLFRAVVGLFAPVTQALYPLSCRKVNQQDGGKSYIKQVFMLISLIAIFIGGCVSIFSKQIIQLIYSEDFLRYSYALSLMMIWMVFGVVNNIIGIQYLTAKKYDKYYLKSFLAAGFVTLFLNIILIPTLVINGVLVSMITGEVILSLFMLYYIYRFKL